MITTNDFCKKEYGQKLYKISFDAGFSCPNRDGTISNGGCIFCSEGGSGDFAVKIFDKSVSETVDFEDRIQLAKDRVASKYKGDKYIAYFQAFSNTYSDVNTLKNLYEPIVKRDDITVLSIATRPDCLNEEIYLLLNDLNKIKPVWIELGLQTTKRKTIDLINRGYATDIYDKAIRRLNELGIHTITHVILYLPGEDLSDMKKTISHAIEVGTKGIKLQLLHVLKNTLLADIYKENPFYIPTLQEYADTLKECLSIIPENIVVHRLTGDPPKRLLIEPAWAKDKKKVLNTITDTITPPRDYYVYMLECADGSYYTGSTNDVIKRYHNHSIGKGCKYSSTHLPVKLVFVENCHSKRKALSREYAIKQLTHKQKESLIKDININEVSSFLL